MKKTILEWYEQLTEPIRSQAIESDLVKAARKVVQYKDLEMDGDLYTAIHELEKALK